MAIVDFCLDIGNIRQNEGIDINGIKFYQNSSALLPSLARKLINKKDELKKQLKLLNPETVEYKDLLLKYDAIKSVVNSLFGVCGLKVFRLFNYKVAASITFLIRDLLHYVEEKLQERDMKVIYIDTDSVFVQAKDNPKDLCNQLIKQWAKEKYNKDTIGIEFDLEGTFEKILIVALCHYKGYLKTKNGIKEEIKGIEAKRKDSSVFIRDFQDALIEKVMNEESRESIELFIASQKEAIKTRSLIDIGFPCKLSQEVAGYKSIPVFVRGYQYTNELTDFKKSIGDSFWWIYVNSFGTSIRKSSRMKTNKETKEKELESSEKEISKDVLCFDEDHQDHIKPVGVAWDRIIDRSITGKVDKIFEAMNWVTEDVSKKRLITTEEATEKVAKSIKRRKKESSAVDNLTPSAIIKSQPTLKECICGHDGVNTISHLDIPKEENISNILPNPYFTTDLGKCYNGSCLDILSALPTDSIDLVFTSPPYNTGNKGKNKNMYTEYNDNLSDDDYYNLLSTCLKESLRVCKGLVFININYMNNNKKVLYRLMYEFVEYLRENIIWDKHRVQPPIGNILGKRYEYILMFSKNPKIEINNFRKNKAEKYTEEFGNWISNLLSVSIKTDQTKFAKTHRAGFPVDLPKIFIDIYTNPGDTILDPFFGLGSTAIASESLARKWIGIELMETYCQISKERIAEFTGEYS